MTYLSKTTENAVEKAVIEFMQASGWRATRNHVGLFTTPYGGKITIGQKDFPDWTFTRKSDRRGVCQLIHWEAKATGKKPNPGQFEKMAALNHLGEFACWANSLEMFKLIYFQNFPEDYAKS